MSSPDTQGAAPVIDRRPVPRGVLPKGIQTWLMVALSVGIVLIILLTGQPQAPERAAAATPAPPPMSPDRVHDYQQRLQALNQQLVPPARPMLTEAPSLPPAFQDNVAPARVDPIDSERRRRDYESLFASNVVVSKRAPLQKTNERSSSAPDRIEPPLPASETSLDDIADAVVRATARGNAAGPATPRQASAAAPPATANPRRELSDVPPQRTYVVAEGTVIDTVLTNRLDGGAASPVNCLVTNAVYSLDSRRVLIPSGSRILGSTRQAEGWGETRLAVGFHRLVLPDGTSVALDQFRGLNQFGDSGLKDRANQHYWSTFGAAAAVGLVGGLSQILGSAALGSGDGDRTVIIAGGSADATSQAAAQSLSKFLNRMPTITIREGHRVKVYVTNDLELPEWNPSATESGR
ncbi:MAG: TrbI/VirB10 family protein [Planctomycetota bacterium]